MPIASAQQPDLAIADVLSHIKKSTEEYSASIPEFFCEEHVVSQELRDGKVKHEMQLISTFSVTRSKPEHDDPTESRQTQFINGKPLKKAKKETPPYWFSGAFQAGGAVPLSDECYLYTLTADTHNKALFILTATSKPSDPLTACKSHNVITTAFDSRTMQITHIDVLDQQPSGRSHRTASWSVDKSPVVLGEKTFWLPSTVRSDLTDARDPHYLGHFEASYSNCHKLNVSSKILSAEGSSISTDPTQ